MGRVCGLTVGRYLELSLSSLSIEYNRTFLPPYNHIIQSKPFQ